MKTLIHFLFERMLVFHSGLYLGMELLGVWKFLKGKDHTCFDSSVFEQNVLDMSSLRI